MTSLEVELGRFPDDSINGIVEALGHYGFTGQAGKSGVEFTLARSEAAKNDPFYSATCLFVTQSDGLYTAELCFPDAPPQTRNNWKFLGLTCGGQAIVVVVGYLLIGVPEYPVVAILVAATILGLFGIGLHYANKVMYKRSQRFAAETLCSVVADLRNC